MEYESLSGSNLQSQIEPAALPQPHLADYIAVNG